MKLLTFFLYSHWQLLKLIIAAPRALFDHGWACAPKRALIFLVFFPLFWVLNLFHFFGFAVDSIVFRGWRRQSVLRPVFVVGVPRSGTTFLHRFLAQDARFTSTQTWEVLLAPSVFEKYLWTAVLKMISPLFSLSRRIAPSFFKQMDGVHKLGLNEAEEDFLFLLGINASFIMIALFPRNRRLWSLTKFDWEIPAWERKLICDYYYTCIAKHVYFKSRRSNSSPTYLAKNPSFSPWVQSLAAHFKDAHFVICLREPAIVLPSQIRSLLPAFALLGSRQYPISFNQQCVSMLTAYYGHLQAFKISRPKVPVVMNDSLRYQLPCVLQQIYRSINLPEDSMLIARAAAYVRSVEPSKAPADYRLEELNLCAQKIQFAFKDVWPVNA